jgi:hypothetical protein
MSAKYLKLMTFYKLPLLQLSCDCSITYGEIVAIYCQNTSSEDGDCSTLNETQLGRLEPILNELKPDDTDIP